VNASCSAAVIKAAAQRRRALIRDIKPSSISVGYLGA